MTSQLRKKRQITLQNTLANLGVKTPRFVSFNVLSRALGEGISRGTRMFLAPRWAYAKRSATALLLSIVSIVPASADGLQWKAPSKSEQEATPASQASGAWVSKDRQTPARANATRKTEIATQSTKNAPIATSQPTLDPSFQDRTPAVRKTFAETHRNANKVESTSWNPLRHDKSVTPANHEDEPRPFEPDGPTLATNEVQPAQMKSVLIEDNSNSSKAWRAQGSAPLVGPRVAQTGGQPPSLFGETEEKADPVVPGPDGFTPMAITPPAAGESAARDPMEDPFKNDAPMPSTTDTPAKEEITVPMRSGIGSGSIGFGEDNKRSQETCESQIAKLRAHTLSPWRNTVKKKDAEGNEVKPWQERGDEIRELLDIHMTGVEGTDFPYECKLDGGVYVPRSWPCITYMWKASALCHNPLYFENEQLERYGHTWGPWTQPFISGAHFFGTIPILPYKMGLETPNECVYALGHYRPNSCAPFMIDPIPFSWRAAAFQTGAVVGVSAIVP